MKNFFQILGGTLIMIGMMAMAGAAGDCDGACGPGNSIEVMLMIVGGGLTAVALGATLIFKTMEA